MKSYNPKSLSIKALELLRPYALSLALGLGIASYSACDDTPSDGDGDVDIDSDIDGDSDSDSDGVSPFPPDYRVENNLHVGLDGVVTVDNNSVVLTAPELNPAYVEAGHETPDNPILTVIATHTEGTPDDPTDDVVEPVISDQPTEWGQNTTGNLNLEERVIGEEIRLSATVTIPGTNPTTKNGITTVTYEQPTDPEAPVIECGLSPSASACLGSGFYCSGTSPIGNDIYGNWSYEITPTLQHLIIDIREHNEEELDVSFGPSEGDVGCYNLRVEVHDGEDHVGTYDNSFFVNRHSTSLLFDEQRIFIPEVLGDDIATNCGNGTFQPSLKSNPEGYTFEMSRAGTPDGDVVMTCVWERILNMNANIPTSTGGRMSVITTMYTPTGETLEDYFGGEPNLVQITYQNDCR